MKILYVSYPLLTVSEESAGGAEQMLWTLEREMAERGISTTVAASAGSQVAGVFEVSVDRDSYVVGDKWTTLVLTQPRPIRAVNGKERILTSLAGLDAGEPSGGGLPLPDRRWQRSPLDEYDGQWDSVVN